MRSKQLSSPGRFSVVMISSTFTDLAEHRAAPVTCIETTGSNAVVMERSSTRPIDPSMRMVRYSDAYIGLIRKRYGQTPECPERNPRKLPLTELAYEEANRLGRPILLFVMRSRHRGEEQDFEVDPGKKEKPASFRERAKQMSKTLAQRVWAEFNSLEEFRERAEAAFPELRRYLDEQDVADMRVPVAPMRPSKQAAIATGSKLYPQSRYSAL